MFTLRFTKMNQLQDESPALQLQVIVKDSCTKHVQNEVRSAGANGSMRAGAYPTLLVRDAVKMPGVVHRLATCCIACTS